MEYDLFTVTSTGRLIKLDSSDWTERDGKSFGPIIGELWLRELDTRDEACSFHDFESALKYWKSLSDSNK